MRALEVVPYDNRWPQLFEQEARKMAEIFGDQVVAIHHVGSTSVPGLAAKPIIDLLVIIKDRSFVDLVLPTLLALGYEDFGEYGQPGRRFFPLGGDHRTHHIHVFEEGDPEIRIYLSLRNYLRRFPDRAREYGDLKLRLATSMRAL